MPIGHKARCERRKQIAEFVRTYSGEGDVRSVAVQEFGVSRATVYAACKECGVTVVKKHGSGVTDRTFKVIAALFTDKSFEEIGVPLGVTSQWVGQVYHRCLKAGIPVRVRTRGRRKS